MLRPTLLILSLVATTSCAQPRQTPLPLLPLPDPPTLPKIRAQDVECLAPNAWKRLTLRDATLRHHNQELRTIIQTFNQEARRQSP